MSKSNGGNERSMAIEKITFSDGFMALAKLMPPDIAPRFLEEAQNHAHWLPKGAAFSIKEFDGPYDLHIDYSRETANLILNIRPSQEHEPEAQYKIPFKAFLSAIRQDRNDLNRRDILYITEKPSVIAAFERLYAFHHAQNAMHLMEEFNKADMFANSLSFFKGFYALLRFAIPLHNDADKTYAKKYADLWQLEIK